MQINQSDIPNEGLDLDFETDSVTLDLRESGAEFGGPVHVRVRLVPMDQSIYVSGETQARVTVQCVRCLEALTFPVRSSFELTVVPKEPHPGRSTGEWRELSEKELDEYSYSGDTIDLTDLIREQVLLALPTYPLCQPSCRGLCPHCGADLNRNACDCIDNPTLGPMTHFREKLKKIIKK